MGPTTVLVSDPCLVGPLRNIDRSSNLASQGSLSACALTSSGEDAFFVVIRLAKSVWIYLLGPSSRTFPKSHRRKTFKYSHAQDAGHR